MFYNFNINTFKFNVEDGGQMAISKSVVEFYEIVIPGPWSSISVASYNELTVFFHHCT
jgi:hypothetical protein